MSNAVVYLDKVLLGNLLVNGIILWAAGRLSQSRVNYSRLLLGSLLGSLYSMALFLPGTGYLYSFPVKIAVSLAMVAAAFTPMPPRRFFACLSFFYLVSFAAGGAVIGFSHLVSREGGFEQISNFASVVQRNLWAGLTLALAVMWAGVAFLPRYFKGRQRIEAVKLPVTIYLSGKGITVQGLVDTGNSLCDPVSGEPVMVVEHSAIREVLPAPMKEAEACANDAVGIIERMADTPWSGRIRLIPFNSLGNDRGILLGIRPDRVEFVRDSRVQRIERVVVGIHGRRFDAGNGYNAIINPSVLDRAVPA